MRTKSRRAAPAPEERALLSLFDARLQPVSLTADTAADLLDAADDGVEYLCSEKTDGARAWLTATRADGAARHDRRGARTPVAASLPEALARWAPLLLDCERVGDELVAFDVHCARGRDTRSLPLPQRQSVYALVAHEAPEVGGLRLRAKPWLPGNRWRDLPCVEGIIWQHATQLPVVWKYKKINTIDLRWDGTCFPTAREMQIEVAEAEGPLERDAIYEMAPEAGGARWRVLHRRDDKRRENARKTIADARDACGLDLHADFC